MDYALTKTLAEAIQAIESGADIDVVVTRYPGREDALRSHLGLWRRLEAAPRIEADSAVVNAGKARMIAAINGQAIMPARPLAGLTTVAAAVVGIFLLGAGAAGASAALGGPDIPGDAFESVGISREGGSSNSSSGSDGSDLSDISTDVNEGAPGDTSDGGAANPNPNENANPNAFEACENSTDGRTNADANAVDGGANANPRAFEGGNSNGEKCGDKPADESNPPTPTESASGNGNANGQGNGQGQPPDDPGNSSSSHAGGNENSQGSPQEGPKP